MARLKAVAFKVAKTGLKISDERLQHIKDRHLVWGELYVPQKSSYFFTEDSIVNLIDTFSINSLKVAKDWKYSITKSFDFNIWFDRVTVGSINSFV